MCSFRSKCQRACEKLDLDATIEAPIMKFFWPQRKKAELTETIEDPYEDKGEREPKRKRKESSSSSDDSDSNHVTRKQFGIFPDSDESSSSSSEEESPKIEEIPADTPDDEEDEYEVLSIKFNTKLALINNFRSFFLQRSEKLEMLSTYLRTTYCYCHWCGVHYTDIDDLESNCPGSTKDDH